MPAPRLLAAASLAASGCSFLYDADDLRQPPPDAVPLDADPTLLTLESAEPDVLYEGQGGEGGRPPVVILHGSSLVDSATVTATLDGVDLPLGRVEIDSTGGDFLAVEVPVPVLPELAAGATATLTFTVTQPAADPATIDVTIAGLDELTLATSPVAEASLAELYSHVDVTAAVHVTGTEPVQLRATGDITIAGVLDVDASGQDPGPHGCAGGNANAPGGCGTGGGRGGLDSELLGTGGGGGGGGFAVDGDGGGGDGAGAGGAPSGNDMLVPLRTGSGAGNRGNGGGGGGDGTLNTGNVGGGGGGVIEVHAGGDVVVTGGGRVRAAGGAGAGGAGAGGGGGSGGAILVRAGGAITSPGAWLDASGGAAGNGGNDGGAGSIGRIRVDAPAGGVPSMGVTTAVAGPAWDAATPTIVTTASVELTLRGRSGPAFGVLVDDEPLDDVTISAGGTGRITVPLVEGRNRVCAAHGPNGAASNLELPEATTCVDLVRVP